MGTETTKLSYKNQEIVNGNVPIFQLFFHHFNIGLLCLMIFFMSEISDAQTRHQLKLS